MVLVIPEEEPDKVPLCSAPGRRPVQTKCGLGNDFQVALRLGLPNVGALDGSWARLSVCVRSPNAATGSLVQIAVMVQLRGTER